MNVLRTKRSQLVLFLLISLLLLSQLSSCALLHSLSTLETQLGQGLTLPSPTSSLSAPSPSPDPSPSPKPSPSPSPVPADEAKRCLEASELYFSGEKLNEALSYFNTVAANSEFSGSKPITKWTDKIYIALHGDYNELDVATVHLMAKLYNQIDGIPEISILEDNPDAANVNIYFVASEDMHHYFSSYVEGNSGFFEVYWDGQYQLYKSVIAISTNRTKAEDRNHLLWEELTQSLGLMNDSYKYEDSIFQQNYSYVQHPSAIDFAILRMLYSEQVRPGATGERAVATLKNLYH